MKNVKKDSADGVKRPQEKISANFKICIDPGHGGSDPGAVANGLRESDINLDVALKLGEILQKAGVAVCYTRNSDVALAINPRAAFANSQNADLYLSIHVNAGGGTGAETFIAPNDKQSLDFATVVNDGYAAKMGLRNRGIKLDSTTRHGSLGVLRNTKMPAILLELAFIDSPAANPDVGILRNKRMEMAAALADGILKFAGKDNGRANPAPTPPKPATPPQSITVEILGKVQNIGGLIENGQTFVRLTDLAAALGFVASWDEGRKMPVVAVAVADKESGRTEFAPTGKFTADEIRLLETIVHWEARGEDEKGQVLVANVVLNRLRNNPTATLHDIVFQPGAFSPTVKPDFNQAQPSATTKSAVKQALDGVDYSQGATFFHALSSISPNVWHEKAVKSGTLAKVFDHGGHRFYKLV